MTRELTEKDRKVLKDEKRIGFVFAGLILSFGGLLNLCYFVWNKSEQEYLMIGIIDLGVFFLAYLICNRINLKVNRDLKVNIKEILKRKVEEKNEEKSYEAGSGALYIPILGWLFPKLWGQKMRETKKYLIFTADKKYEVDKDIYDDLKKDTDFYIHFAKHSETVLSFSKDE
ncbi:MAG: hypothetical protein A2W91_12805 [Bacteroidetes bacterium GWF2_38_335]|nr:MAG: hypothetical protein A2W91_12805 [Bacteroidetes bacterium GWF2_38_335]OFY77046.1 MAG: hypothetical protein A2281_00915 [Bacteroidetes bacterium RIFOXYA12_FULL_38_20]HBS86905.1 hypothetical protein [Bacteroidales bacterium]